MAFILILLLFNLVIRQSRSSCPFADLQLESPGSCSYPVGLSDDENTVYTKSYPLLERLSQINCDYDHPYVRPSGICNRVGDPLYGASYTPQSRIVPAFYGDGQSSIRGDINNEKLVSVRLIANLVAEVNAFNPPPSEPINHAAVIFGLYYEEDLNFPQIFVAKPHDGKKHCCSADRSHYLSAEDRRPGCYSMDNEGFNDPFGIGCIDFVRSIANFSDYDSLYTAAYANTVTHWMDNSGIYGYSPQIERSLRTYRGGELKNSQDDGILPIAPNCTGPKCHFSGDSRGIKFTTKTVFHTMFLRLHNTIARQLRAQNAHWDDEKTFREARRLGTAIYQSITYNEYAPLLLGEEECLRRGLKCDAMDGDYCGLYDVRVDGRSSEDFIAAARQMHLNIPLTANLYDKDYQLTGVVDMDEITQIRTDLLKTEHLTLWRGMLADSAVFDIFPEFLRKIKDEPDEFARDVLAMDIGRGRDHGLAPYAIYYEYCFGRPINDFFDLIFDISYTNILLLQKLYLSVRDVEFNVGIVLEEKRNAVLGPVAKCIFTEQFHRTKIGDRFFYSVPNGANPFTPQQLRSIDAIKFSDVLCLTTDLEKVPERAFIALSAQNPLRSCENTKWIDLKLWQDKM